MAGERKEFDEHEARRRWDEDETIRAEFITCEDWMAYARAEARGLIRILSGKVTKPED